MQDASTLRRAVEKRSRERIGHSLKELKRLLPNFKQHGSKTGEQIDLLQSAVDYLKSVQTSSSVDQLSWSTDSAKSTPSLGEGPLPSLFNPPLAPVDAMMDGYQDCMEETIRYLVQVEGFPPNHDIIIRLRAHLIQSQSKLDLNNQLRTSQARLTLDQYYDLQQQQQQQRQHHHHRAGQQFAAAGSTQTSPQLAHTNACAAYPPGSALLARNGTPAQEALHSKTAPGQASLSQLPLGVMTPLTVDTNQYYAMPSPLAHCLSEGALARQGSAEPLLTIARTLPTNSGAAFSARGGGPTAVTCSNSTAGRTAPRGGTNPRTEQRLSVQSIAPSVASNVSGSHLGFNLNYDAPYLVAFVRPAAQ
ncbi:hairy/enhancer-of-split related with YRPW motif protein 1-like isoform X2 [Acanthaster planci]|uniref:Hairy/enhancer-of-split related with YRPW motif protein 1-like isoform X2 n=1 Tax=Acanthaster planci TaxID=133434 RepID=A0A8B7YNI6_ACAPL|nr:hairy/enhancer-of-split related with YRPW motif protein 1-like isoform X2 [Acanthaster planci]